MTSEIADRSAEVRGRSVDKCLTGCSARLELAVLHMTSRRVQEEGSKEKEVSGVWIGVVSVWEGAGTC